MNLDRCLLLSWIEEDNIQKAYFRIRPLLTAEGDVRAEAEQLWPSEGCLRIVPDRNELHSFKSRMRALGSWCVVDLRGLPADAGKIRTNKNFNPARGEVNQYILYSDTVKSMPGHSFYEIVDGQASDVAACTAIAVTPRFFIREGDTLYGPVNREDPQPLQPAGEATGTLFELPCPDGKTRLILCMDDAPAPVVRPRAAKPAAIAQEAPAAPVQEAVAPAEPAADVEASAPVQAEAAPAPAASVEAAAPQAPEAPAADTLPIGQHLHILDQSKGHDETLQALDKPVSAGANLLQHRPAQPIQPHPVQDSKTAPTGGTRLIPTPLRTSQPQPKNRLQELATGHFIGAHGVYEPPTTALPRNAQMTDVVNPVQNACTALRQAWHHTGAHAQLLDCILSLDGFRTNLEKRLCQGGTTLLQKVLRDHLQDLEAERLTALCELDRARRDADAYREEVIAGIRARLEKETRQLTHTVEEATAQADALKGEINALQEQRDALAARVQQLQQDALPAEVARLLTDAQMLSPTLGTPLRMSPAAGSHAAPEELLQRLMAVCEASGVTLSRNEAIAALVLLALSPRMGLVCPTVAPLATLCRNIAAAFGWSGSFVHQFSQEQRPMVTARPADSAPAILMTSLQNYAAISGVTKVLVNRNVPGMVRNAAYDADSWPVVVVPALPFVEEIPAAEDVVPVSAASLTALLEHEAADQQAIRNALNPVLRAAPPLSGSARRNMFRFISACAGLMEGGFATAADWAILLWVIPAVDRAGRHYAAVKATLDEYPMSLAAL